MCTEGLNKVIKHLHLRSGEDLFERRQPAAVAVILSRCEFYQPYIDNNCRWAFENGFVCLFALLIPFPSFERLGDVKYELMRRR